MPQTADQIQVQIDSLQRAMSAGVLIVGSGTDKVQYQTYSDMARAMQTLQAQLAAANGTPPRSRLNYIRQNSKGFAGRCDPFKDFS